MTFRNVLTAILLTLACGLYAQDVVMTVQPDNFPYIRGQWTEKDWKAWQEKYGVIRGINCPFPPCGDISQDDALAKAASLGYNSVRWWPWDDCVENYINDVEKWAAMAARHGMTVSPVFDFVHRLFFQTEDRAKGLEELEATVRTVVRHFRNDERIVLWDIWNEPNMNDANTAEIMSWIAKMVQWCREEGCTQPITSSIVYLGGVANNTAADTELRLLREKTESMMDIHNYHDYECQDGFNQDTPTMVERFRKLDNRPMVCTECMCRTNGSTYSRTLVDFARYNISFYTWGLYACDPNWEVKWDRSAFYNWEPMFHNALYMDGEPYDEKELQWVMDFHFSDGRNVDPGAENTERWSTRRAWKRMHHAPCTGLRANSIAEAVGMLSAITPGTDGNTMAVRVRYSQYDMGTTALYKEMEAMLEAAGKAGVTVIPILLDGEDRSVPADNLQEYAYSVVNRFYCDRRIGGWCIYQQTDGSDVDFVGDVLPLVFRKARYAFANQPLFSSPMLDEGITPSESSDDACNRMWRLSDICSYTSSDGEASAQWLVSIEKAYMRPILSMSDGSIVQRVTDLRYTTAGMRERMPAWEAWRWMNREPVKGVYYVNVTSALRNLNAMKESGTNTYNSFSVQLDPRQFSAGSTIFFSNVDSLLALASELGMTMLPRMMNDSYATMDAGTLGNYVRTVLQHYSQERRILGWNLYDRPCASSTDKGKAEAIMDELFAAARESGAVQPVFVTPNVMAQNFASGFDSIENLKMGSYQGWNKVTFGNADLHLCYKAWCMSDVISYSSAQTASRLGWVNSIACKFGRPLFCLGWKPVASSVNETLDIFQDMQVAWYNSGTLDPESYADFHYIPVSTEH